MARFARYLREEKYITTQDAGGIRKRWEYGRRLLEDRTTTHPNGRLKHGVGDTLVGNATASGYRLSHSEIRYRLQAGKTYETEAKLAKILGEFDNWWSLIQAGFPAVEAPDDDVEPHDPRDSDEKWRDFRNEMERRNAQNPHQGALWDVPDIIPHDTYGPRAPVDSLVAYIDERERMTANFVKKDAEIRAYVDELVAATGGNLNMSWYEAEGRRLGLAHHGLGSWDEFDEIMREFRGDPGNYLADPDTDDE